jgi:hypothetical protein
LQAIFKLLAKAILSCRVGYATSRWVEETAYDMGKRAVAHLATKIDPDYTQFKESWYGPPTKNKKGKKVQPHNMRDLLESKYKAQKDLKSTEVVSFIIHIHSFYIKSNKKKYLVVHQVHGYTGREDLPQGRLQRPCHEEEEWRGVEEPREQERGVQ